MKLLFIALIIPSCFCQAQSNPGTEVTNITKLTFLNPGISYEAKVGKMQTLYAQAFLNTTAYFSWSSTFGSSSGVYFDPAATAQYRYYYNAAARNAKGKRTKMNSMNYIAGMVETIFTQAAADEYNLKEVDRRPVTTVGLAWGLQRNGLKRFSLDLNLGIGYLFAKGTVYNGDYTNETHSVNVSKFTGIGQINLGFWLNNR
jgi:hypothetical protein